jgi:CRP/FNR family transcriptional regulator, cyclic AMP receptor protein
MVALMCRFRVDPVSIPLLTLALFRHTRVTSRLVGTTTFEIFRTVDEVERFQAGDVIFKAGDTGDCMYVVRDGTVTIHAEGLPIEEVGPGGIFGELALIDSSPRSATATATSACELVALNERSFLFHVSQTPFFALNVMRVLSERLRRASAQAPISAAAQTTESTVS